VDIGTEGEYRFEVIPPRGWIVTTDNAIQVAHFVARPQTRAGIVADQVPHPIGLAPTPKITGRVLVRLCDVGFSPAPGILMQAVSVADGARLEATTSEEGKFSFDLEPGDWRIREKSPEASDEAVRVVRADYVPVQLSAIVQGEQASSNSRLIPQTLIDFDLITKLPITKMPTYPNGLEWVNLIISKSSTYLGAGYRNNTVSGSRIGYNSSGYPVTVTRDRPFDFVGAYFGVAWPQAEGETLEIRAWRGDELVGEDKFSLSAMGPVWFDADYRDVTRVELATRNFWQFVMDGPVFRFVE